MSSVSHSPPKTPLKSRAGVEKDNPESNIHVLNNNHSDNVQKAKLDPPEMKAVCEPAAAIQIPDALPVNDDEDRKLLKDDQHIELVKASSDQETTVPEIENQKETNDGSEDPQANLPDFDWQNFECRYMTAIRQASHAEDALLDEFDRLSQVSPIRISQEEILTSRSRFLYGLRWGPRKTTTDPASGKSSVCGSQMFSH